MSRPLTGPPGLHSALSEHTGFLLSRLGRVAQQRFGELLEATGLTTRMWSALNVLEHEGPLTQHALGRLIGMDPSSMVATIDELETHGLVERRQHPTDRRAHALHVTSAGRKTLARGRAIAAEAQNELLAPLSAAERGQLHELLLRVSEGRADAPASPE